MRSPNWSQQFCCKYLISGMFVLEWKTLIWKFSPWGNRQVGSIILKICIVKRILQHFQQIFETSKMICKYLQLLFCALSWVHLSSIPLEQKKDSEKWKWSKLFHTYLLFVLQMFFFFLFNCVQFGIIPWHLISLYELTTSILQVYPYLILWTRLLLF